MYRKFVDFQETFLKKNNIFAFFLKIFILYVIIIMFSTSIPFIMQKEKLFQFFKSSNQEEEPKTMKTMTSNLEQVIQEELNAKTMKEIKIAQMKYNHKMKNRMIGAALMIASLIGLYFKVEYSGWLMFAGFLMLDVF